MIIRYVRGECLNRAIPKPRRRCRDRKIRGEEHLGDRISIGKRITLEDNPKPKACSRWWRGWATLSADARRKRLVLPIVYQRLSQVSSHGFLFMWAYVVRSQVILPLAVM